LCWSYCFILLFSFIILGLFWDVSPFDVDLVGPKAAPIQRAKEQRQCDTHNQKDPTNPNNIHNLDMPFIYFN
jgi:hypothetical protein